MSRANKGRKKTGRSLLITVLLLAVIGGGLLGLHFWEEKNLAQEAAEIEARSAQEDAAVLRLPTVQYNGQSYAFRDDLETLLIMGLDKYENTLSDSESYINNQQSDFLLLVIIDAEARSCCALHINRDAMAEIQRLGLGGARLGTFTGQLALAHTYGSGEKDSCRNTVQAVSRYLYDIPIDHYMSVTMDAVATLNDLVGGVVVHIDDDFSAIDPTLVMGTDVRLRGQQALTFVRTRKDVDDQTNLSRMNRQREYLYSLYTQLIESMRQKDGFALDAARKLGDYTVSDLTVTELSNLGERLKDYTFTTIYSIDGVAIKGERFMEFYTDDDALRQTVIKLFYRLAEEG